MRDFRIRKINADKLIQDLNDQGYETYLSKCKPRTTWGSGCSDPNCCPQHPDAIIETLENGIQIARMPDDWTAITTEASSNIVHQTLQKIFEE